MPVNVRSAVYRPVPVTLSLPSGRMKSCAVSVPVISLPSERRLASPVPRGGGKPPVRPRPLPREATGDVQPGLVLPGVPVLGRRPREHPPAEAIGVQLEERREALERRLRGLVHPTLAVEQVLRGVVRPVADE